MPKPYAEKRAQRIAEGKCVRCSQANDRHGERLVCTKCKDLLTERMRSYRRKWHEEWRCTKCSMPLDDRNVRHHCRRCQDMQNRKDDARRKRHTEAGLCCKCGCPMYDDPHKYCPVCQAGLVRAHERRRNF